MSIRLYGWPNSTAARVHWALEELGVNYEYVTLDSKKGDNKTPEYLAAGKPVISTSIRDVIRPYGELRLVRIADTAEQFVKAAEAAMAEDEKERIRLADAFLSRLSWDRTWGQMNLKIEDAIAAKGNVGQKLRPAIGIGSVPRLAESIAASGD